MRMPSQATRKTSRFRETKVSTKEMQEKLVERLGQWQKIEDRSVESTNKILSETDHPLLRLVMEIIQQDSKMHRRVQQLVIDCFTRQPVHMTPDELAEVWTSIEDHVALEKRMITSVREALDAVRGKKELVPEYLLSYLLADEQKHDQLLSDLENIKRGMYPYSG